MHLNLVDSIPTLPNRKFKLWLNKAPWNQGMFQVEGTFPIFCDFRESFFAH